jgi:hypothetical protein
VATAPQLLKDPYGGSWDSLGWDERSQYSAKPDEQDLKNVQPLNPWGEKYPFPRLYFDGSGFETWDYSDEDAWTENDKFNTRKIRVVCPNCGREFCALSSKLTVYIDGGLRWVGCDHREPYARWGTRCTRCNCKFMFETHTPQ